VKRLDITTIANFHTWLPEDGLDGPGPGYDGMLALCTDTLEYLKPGIEWDTNSVWQLGPANTLTSLPLQNLKYIEAQPAVIFESLYAINNADICDHLPSELERIRLYDETWGFRSSNHGENERIVKENPVALKAAMLYLVLHSQRRLPQVGRVQIGYSWYENDRTFYSKSELDDEVELQGLYTTSEGVDTYSTMIYCVTL